MRLYPLNAPRSVIDHPEWGHFEADPDHGGFELPDELSEELHSFHHRGKRVWETEDERSVRLHENDLARRRDPASLYDAVGNFTDALTRMTSQVPASAPQLTPDEERAVLLKRLAELEDAGKGNTGEDADGGESEGGTGESDESDGAEAEAAKPAPRRRPAAKSS